MKRQTLVLFSAVLACGINFGCAGRIPRHALAMHPQTLEHRQRSSRRFETADERHILTACAGVLQDLGFTLEGSESELGLIVGSKDRSAVEAGQVAGKFMMAVLFGADVPIDRNQKFRASIVTHPSGTEIVVRVTFQRIVWNDYGRISRLELIDDPDIYQEFFIALSKAVFLEANEI